MRCVTDEKKNNDSRMGVLLAAVMLLAVSVQGAVVPVSTQTLELKPGWNLVTLLKPLDSKPVNAQKLLALKVMCYDVKAGAYVSCDRLEDVKAGVGYWVFSQEKQTIELALDVNSAAAEPSLEKGWNLVGMTEGASWVKLDVPIWAWENGCFVQVVDKLKLQVGNAYWIYMNE